VPINPTEIQEAAVDSDGIQLNNDGNGGNENPEIVDDSSVQSEMSFMTSILLACDESKLLGTIALLHHSDQVCEISKMTVAKNYRGQNIGKFLLESIINQAKQKSYGYIILYANSKLESAIHLYEKFGFYRVPIDSEGDKYGSRCDLAYRMDI
jgi:ribosomal protein S18 acetylase RimI-like enzyme